MFCRTPHRRARPMARWPEKLWRAQFPDTRRWQLAAPFEPDFHFTLLALARCEIQAIDQHWSLHRMAVSLPDGELDDHFAREIGFQPAGSPATAEIAWPSPDPASWGRLLLRALEHELADELAQIRARQDNSLRRELERIDGYFENYERELNSRAKRSANEKSKFKTADRLAAAKTEHARRRPTNWRDTKSACIRIWLRCCWWPKLPGARECMWNPRATAQTVSARFVPRSRRWIIEDRKI